jgi:hypothetical protein
VVDYTNPGNVQTADQVVAHETGADLQAPRTNQALQLAGALSGINEHLPDLLQGIGQDMRTRVAAKAHADAMATSGQAFADAVKAGKIEPTQNPWYIRAYNENAAQVQGQAAVSNVVTDSQQWQERNDPVAYANRFHQELGKIAAQPQFQGIDGSAGFAKAAEPLREQALNQNTEYNVQRINQENVQNTSTLTSTAIQTALSQNPKAAPADVWAATEPAHQQWLSTGGTEQQWNMLLKNSVYGAAGLLQDPTVIDLLKDNRGGKGAIANMADETGKPVAAEMESEKYWIDRGVETNQIYQMRTHQAAVENEALKVNQWAQTTYGQDWFYNMVSLNTLKSDALKAGFSQDGINAAVKEQAATISASDTFAKAQIEQHSMDPAISTQILTLHSRAMKEGSSADLDHDVFSQVASGNIERHEGEQILAEARQQSNYLTSQGRADASEARAEQRADRSFKLETAQTLKQYGDTTLATVASTLSQGGDPVLDRNPQQRLMVERSIRDAIVSSYAKSQDPILAQQAGDAVAASYLKKRRAIIKGPPGGGNPNAQNPRGQ